MRMQHVVLSLFFVKNLKNVKMYYCVLKKYCVTKSHNYLFLALSWATLSPKKIWISASKPSLSQMGQLQRYTLIQYIVYVLFLCNYFWHKNQTYPVALQLLKTWFLCWDSDIVFATDEHTLYWRNIQNMFAGTYVLCNICVNIRNICFITYI